MGTCTKNLLGFDLNNSLSRILKQVITFLFAPVIIRKSRVLYPGPGFLSSATWPSLPKPHYTSNGLVIVIIIDEYIVSTVW